MNIFIGILNIQNENTILMQCDIAQTEYVLKNADDYKKAVLSFLSKATKLK